MAITTIELLDRPRSTSAAGAGTAYVVMLGLLVVAAVASANVACPPATTAPAIAAPSAHVWALREMCTGRPSTSA